MWMPDKLICIMVQGNAYLNYKLRTHIHVFVREYLLRVPYCIIILTDVYVIKRIKNNYNLSGVQLLLFSVDLTQLNTFDSKKVLETNQN